MMKASRWLLFLFVLALAGCGRSSLPTVSPDATRTPNLPYVGTTSVPDVGATARAYLDAWKAEDYATMYSLLTPISKDALSEEDFTKHYRGVSNEAALSGLDYEIFSSGVLSPDNAQVSYRVILHSILVGDIQSNTLMNLGMDKGQWRVQWDDTLVLPQLAGGNYLGMERYIPARANIYDRNGHALVAQADATAIGLRPALLDPEQEGALFSYLTELTGLREDTIRGRIEAIPAGSDWYLPLGEVPAGEVENRIDVLSALSGLELSSYKSRYYFDGGIAPHVLGYVGTIQEGEADEYLRKGYRIDERVGLTGLEKWGEAYLSGERGGALYVFDSQGQIETKLAEIESQPSEAIYTTLERDFQLAVQQSIEGFRAAAVVLEMNTGRVLAMASSPGFDPNAFEPANLNSSSLVSDYFSDPSNPTFNRASQGQYPLGSVFKIITMATALETGRYNAGSTYQCGYFFDELPGLQLHDWTWDFFQEDGETIPSGLLTLPQGLMRSCNPFFYHIGLDLYNQGLTTEVSETARKFGLGTKTGIEGVEEEAGQVIDPTNPVDATNQAIGQGDLLVTPLQVATFIAAVGNGGTLYRPQVIERIAPPDGTDSFSFKPEAVGELPVSQENLKLIQDSMVGVMRSTKPYGTAWHVFTGLDINVAGKTGTAESGSGMPHAWFAGYTFEGREDAPDIAVVVLMENIGQGSTYAAPVFRRIVENYFYDRPARLYPWESTYGVTATPTLPGELVTETPEP